MSNKDKAPKEPKEPKRGVGTAVMEAIKAEHTNEEALEITLKEFPDARTSLASVNWYRNKMRSMDKTIPTARELKKKRTAAAPKATKDPLE